jgi:hypothetical protein
MNNDMMKFFKRNSLVLGIITCILGFVTGLVCMIIIDVTTWEQTFFTMIVSGSTVMGIFLSGRLKQKRKQLKKR